MGLDADQLREAIIRPALQSVDLWSQAAENLVMGTAAQESMLQYVVQIRGPALGLFQVEPATYFDYWDSYINRRPQLRQKILASIGASVKPRPQRCVYDLRLAAIMCRVHYLRIRAPLPDEHDVWGMASYWKKYYNTYLGRGTQDEFVRNYRLTQ